MGRGAFITFYACGLGPLSWACLLLGNGFVFHSIEKISSLFIHITPSLVLWTVTFHNEKLTETWPGRFPTTLEMNTWGKREIFYHGVQFYAVWLLLHSVWLLTHGVTCPQRGLATVLMICSESTSLIRSLGSTQVSRAPVHTQQHIYSSTESLPRCLSCGLQCAS